MLHSLFSKNANSISRYFGGLMYSYFNQLSYSLLVLFHAIRKLVFVTILIVALSNVAFAQLATYTGTGGTSTAVVGIPNETVTILQKTGFGTNTPCGSGGLSGITVSTIWSTYSSAGPHVYIQIYPNAGYQLNVTGFNVITRESGTGPTKARLAYSLDNGTSWIDEGIDHAQTVGASCGSSSNIFSYSGGLTISGITSTTNGIIVALYPFAPASSAGTFQVNSIVIGGNVTCAPPAAIAGITGICLGATSTLTDATPGGTWSSSNPSVATIGTSTGVVSGISVGNATITYTTPAGCYTTTLVTVNPLPAPILGTASFCIGATTLLTDATAGGSWSSSNPLIATVGTGTGIVTGISAGTAMISYTLPTGCAAVTTVTVISTPAPISGPSAVCVGSTSTLTDVTTGGTWTSSNTVVATIGISSGIVNGISVGTTTISYSVGTSCIATLDITVNPNPSIIYGPTSVCVGSAVTLVNDSITGTWSSSNPAIATVGTGTGIVSGISAGTATISYSLGTGCSSVLTVTVLPLPIGITGIPSLCVGSTTTLVDAGGGTWTSSNTAVATVGSLTGVVSGITAGISTITYTLSTGCYTTLVVTVNSLPAAIAGPSILCAGSTITLTDATPGGTWSSSAPAIATIGSSSGIVSGILPGTTVISYTLGTGCFSSRLITVNPVPSLFSVTGGGSYCAGGVGLHIGTSGSSIGINYQLYNGVTPVGLPVAGSGGLLDFGLQTAAGTYTVKGVNSITGCSVFMTGSVTITINPLPSLITGPASVCVGATMFLNDVTPGGTWSTTGPSAAVVPGTGLVTGISAGAAVITYTIGTGCFVTKSITVNPIPTISGPLVVCPAATIALTGTPSGGTWTSGSPAIATIGTSSGIVTGVATGTSIITYTLPVTGCKANVTVTVSPAPTAITGASSVCAGLTTLFTDGIPGGTWTSSTPAIATIGSSSGVVTGIAAGSATITYALGSGCIVVKPITVNPSPVAISGTTTVCVGNTAVLTDATPGGAWSSATPGVATISPGGIVTGVSAGTTSISYLVGGCPAITTVTVNPLPAPVTGTLSVCIGQTTLLSDPVPGGTWSISPVLTATIGSSSGVVTGVNAGIAIVTYTLPTGCLITANFTVNPLPAAISGASSVCQGLSITLIDVTPGGTWSSGTPAVASISGGGIVTGITPGVSVISYALTTTGCAATRPVTVTPAPSAILGSASVCVGQTTLLSNYVLGGTWTSSNPAIATVGSLSGIVTGITTGTATIVYSVGGCTDVSKVITVVASPLPIAGPVTVCIGSTILKSDASPGGTWSSSDPTLATIGGTGIVSGIASGTVIISYTLGTTGCTAISPLVVNPVSAILGSFVVCQGQTTVLSDTTLGGTWTSSAPSIATVAPYSGVVTGIAGGAATITYMLPTGCIATKVVTVNPLPASIVGVPQVCIGHTTNLTNTTPGGIWSSSNTAVAVVGSTGIVSGIAAGTTTISYTLGTGCASTVVLTVNPLPTSISGPTVVCIGGTISLSDGVSGGAWSTSNPAIATIGTSTGIVTGVSIGSVIIHYTLGTGCNAATVVNVDTMPGSITGLMNLCVGSTSALSDAPAGGTWSSGNIAVATVGSYSGIVFGNSNGIALISYSLGTGCTVTTPVTVNPLPVGISGASNVCAGATTLFTDITSGGTWTSSDPSVAAVGSVSGLVSGISAGLATITYSLGTGCTAVQNISVNPAPAPITGISSTCVGSTTSLSDATPSGTWSSSNPAVAPVSPTGVVSGLALGVVTISYTAGCTSTLHVTVNPFPTAISGNMNVCVGASTVLHDSVSGGTWSSSDLAVATVGSGTGIVTGISAGTVTITYSVGSGCDVTATITVNPLPSPIFGPNQVCATQNMTLSDSQPGGIWTSGSLGVATIDSFTGLLTGVSAGIVTISYTVGCSATYMVTVNPMPAPISGAGNVCLGGTSALHDTVTGGTWWSTNTAVVTVGSVSGIVNGVVLGTATISYILPAGCAVSKVVNVYPLPVVFAVSGGGSYCAGGTGVHIYLSGSTVGVNYMLYRGITATGTFAGTGGALDFGLQTVGGTYTVIGTSTATSCSSVMADSAVITVNPSFAPTVNIIVNPGDTVCVGTSVTFTPVPVYGGSTPSYLWDVNGFPVAFSTAYTFIPADGDVVGVTMTSSIACPMPATANHTVRMNVLPFMSPAVSILPTPGDTICSGTLVTLSPVTSYAGSAPAYKWMKNGDVAGIMPVYSWIPDDGDIVYCIMHSSYPCRTKNIDTSADILITVDTPIAPRVTIGAVPGTSIVSGQTLTLTALVSGGAADLTYQWFKNGILLPGATSSTYTNNNFNYPKPDSVTCMVTTNSICTVTGFGWTYINVENVGVSTLSRQGGISIVPNPNNGEFMIAGVLNNGADEDVAIEITNMLGQVVYMNKTIAKKGKLNERVVTSGNLANGMYVLSLRTQVESRVFHLMIEN